MIKAQISEMIQQAIDGNVSACEVYSLLIDLKGFIERGIEEIKEGALNEAREFNKDQVYYGGYWQVRNTPVYLDFSKDEVFENLNKLASERKKDLNAAWKAHSEGKGFFDSGTGEELPILPVKTPAKEIVVFKKLKDERS